MIKKGQKIKSLVTDEIGFVVEVTNNLQFILVNFSDKTGVKFRWVSAASIKMI